MEISIEGMCAELLAKADTAKVKELIDYMNSQPMSNATSIAAMTFIIGSSLAHITGLGDDVWIDNVIHLIETARDTVRKEKETH